MGWSKGLRNYPATPPVKYPTKNSKLHFFSKKILLSTSHLRYMYVPEKIFKIDFLFRLVMRLEAMVKLYPQNL